MADSSMLERVKGGKYRVVVSVPKDLQPIIGKTKLKRALDTDSLTKANQLKHAVILELRAELAEARQPKLPADQSYIQAAVRMRETLAAVPADSDEANRIREEIDYVREHILSEKLIRGADGNSYTPNVFKERADLFASIALGRTTPLRQYVQKFHDQENWTKRTRADNIRALEYLEDWCKQNSIPLTVEAIDLKAAGEFAEALQKGVERPDRRKKGGRTKASPLENRTINKYTTCLSRYWEWMRKRGYLAEGPNVWKDQSLPEAQAKEGEKERPFTQDELSALLGGEPIQPYMKPLIMIAALTGARIGAIIELTVADTANGHFRFLPHKSEKSSRLVPIHSALVPIVESLCRNKAPTDSLFPECPPIQPGDVRERSMPAVKAFGRYRQSVGVGETVSGKRRSLVNFHSFRRWFITEALRAGQPEMIVQAVVGHKPSSITLNTYHGGFSMEQLRACVEAVKLPVPAATA